MKVLIEQPSLHYYQVILVSDWLISITLDSDWLKSLSSPGLPWCGHHLPAGGGGTRWIQDHGEVVSHSPQAVHDLQHGEDHVSLTGKYWDQWEHSIAVYISVSADVSHHQKVQLRSSQTSPRSGSWNNICSALADHVVWSRASCLLWCCQTLRLLHRWSSSDACVPSCCYCSAQRTGNIGHRWSSQIFSS